MKNDKSEDIVMEAEFIDTDFAFAPYHIRFRYNNILIDTSDTLDAGWETAIQDTRIGEWYILKNYVFFDDALAGHGKVIYQILSGKRRFKNLDTDKFVKLEVI
jgi:hypothetical protein